MQLHLRPKSPNKRAHVREYCYIKWGGKVEVLQVWHTKDHLALQVYDGKRSEEGYEGLKSSCAGIRLV